MTGANSDPAITSKMQRLQMLTLRKAGVHLHSRFTSKRDLPHIRFEYLKISHKLPTARDSDWRRQVFVSETQCLQMLVRRGRDPTSMVSATARPYAARLDRCQRRRDHPRQQPSSTPAEARITTSPTIISRSAAVCATCAFAAASSTTSSVNFEIDRRFALTHRLLPSGPDVEKKIRTSVGS